MASSPSKTVCSALPKGWMRSEVVRQTGISAGKVDVYYYSPKGDKIRSKAQLARYLGDKVNLASFDYSRGMKNSSTKRPKKKEVKQENNSNPKVNNISPSKNTNKILMPPFRQTAEVFELNVSISTTQNGYVNEEFTYGKQETPRQLCADKRLEGLNVYEPLRELIAVKIPVEISAQEELPAPKPGKAAKNQVPKKEPGPTSRRSDVIKALHESDEEFLEQAAKKPKQE